MTEPFVSKDEQRWVESVLVASFSILNIALLIALVATRQGLYLLPQLSWTVALVLGLLILWSSMKYWHSAKCLLWIGVVLLSVGGYLSCSIRDFSFDGMRYHQMIVYSLSHGWLPWEPWSDFCMRYTGSDTFLLPVNSVADEGFWIGTFHLTGAMIVSVLGRHESAKLYQWIFLLLNFYVCYWGLCRLGMRRGFGLFYALLLAFNPVSVYQLMSFAQDGGLSSLLVGSMVLLFLNVTHPNKISLFLFFAHLFPVALSKLPGIGYAGLLLGIMFLGLTLRYVRGRRQIGRFLPVAIVAYLIFVNVGGLIHIWPVNDSFTAPKNFNFLKKRISFPMSHPGMSGIEGLDEMNHFETFVRSNLSETAIAPGKFLYKNPFVVTGDEIRTLTACVTEFRTGGFGPLYAVYLSASLLVFILSLRTLTRANAIPLSYVLLFFLVSGAVLPTFWARWIPHFGVLGLVILIPYWLRKNQHPARSNWIPLVRLQRALPAIACGIYLCNVVLLGVSMYAGNSKRDREVDALIESLKEYGRPVELYFQWFPSNELWLQGREVRYVSHYLNLATDRIPKKVLECSVTKSFPGSDSLVVFPEEQD